MAKRPNQASLGSSWSKRVPAQDAGGRYKIKDGFVADVLSRALRDGTGISRST